MTAVPTPRDMAGLRFFDHPWDPFSFDEALWHGCPGHEWVRGWWDKDERTFREHGAVNLDSGEMITRCARCGAPRCDSFEFTPLPDETDFDQWMDRRELMTDRERQRYRCTLERHHRVPHDFLDGTEVEVGG